jgi:hypothetical protein
MDSAKRLKDLVGGAPGARTWDPLIQLLYVYE